MPRINFNPSEDKAWWDNYNKKLLHPRWQRKRLKIFERDNFRCTRCCDTETTLQLHHLKYHFGKDPWDIPDKDLATLCVPCHELVTKEARKNRRFKVFRPHN